MKNVNKKIIIFIFSLFVISSFSYISIAKGKKKGKKYVGTNTCLSCHSDALNKISKTSHKVLFGKKFKYGCESCHGKGSLHIDNPPKNIFSFKKKKQKINKICLKCHQKDKQDYKETLHSKNLSCISCHKVHNVKKALLKKPQLKLCLSCHKEKNGEINLPSHHPLENVTKNEKVNCSSCHSPHSSLESEIGDTSQDLSCVKCHNEKNGPFVYEHEPVSETCLNCHSPHGSVNQNLLKLKQPTLCLQCHIDLPSTHPSITSSTNRNCVNCHKQIHGSNKNERFFQ